MSIGALLPTPNTSQARAVNRQKDFVTEIFRFHLPHDGTIKQPNQSVLSSKKIKDSTSEPRDQLKWIYSLHRPSPFLTAKLLPSNLPPARAWSI